MKTYNEAINVLYTMKQKLDDSVHEALMSGATSAAKTYKIKSLTIENCIATLEEQLGDDSGLVVVN